MIGLDFGKKAYGFWGWGEGVELDNNVLDWDGTGLDTTLVLIGNIQTH